MIGFVKIKFIANTVVRDDATPNYSKIHEAVIAALIVCMYSCAYPMPASEITEEMLRVDYNNNDARYRASLQQAAAEIMLAVQHNIK